MAGGGLALLLQLLVEVVRRRRGVLLRLLLRPATLRLQPESHDNIDQCGAGERVLSPRDMMPPVAALTETHSLFPTPRPPSFCRQRSEAGPN